MKIKKVILRHLKLNLLHPFTTSFGTELDREFILIEAINQSGISGWGESVAMINPYYNEESIKTNWHILEDYLIPIIFKNNILHPDELSEKYFSHIRRNYMAKSAIEGAIWDIYAQEKNISLSKALGGIKKEIEVGVSIGIQNSIEATIRIIDKRLEEGYKRFKLKIKPGWDINLIEAVRKIYPELPLMVDANSAYTLSDAGKLMNLDHFNLMMIEQPLAHDDIVDHAELQKKMTTPLCLDESIHSFDDCRKAIELGSCKIINIKVGRVCGLTQSRKIHDLSQKHAIPVWCGGMLESGIGRAHNIAITSLSNFVLPGDTAASALYWAEDIIEPEIMVNNGKISITDIPGIGYRPNMKNIIKHTLNKKIYTC